MLPTIPQLTLSVIAAAALTENRMVTGTGAVPAAGAATLGVTRTRADLGDRVPVDVLGTTEVEIGGTATAGGPAMTDNQGRAVDHTGVNIKVGKFMTGGTVAGTTVELLLIPNA